MGALTGPSIVTSGLVFNADSSNINSYNSNFNKNHSRNTWFCFLSGTGVYALEAGVALYQRTDAGIVTTAVAASNSPQRGTLSITGGYTYYGDGPIFMNVEDGNHYIAPVSMAGTQFYHSSNRYNPIVFYMYAPTATTVSFYDNPASLGMYGTPTSTTSMAAGSYTTISTNNLGSYYLKSTAPVLIVAAGTSGDRTILSPLENVIFRRIAGTSYAATALGTTPTKYSTTGFAIWDNTYPVGCHNIGDGSGGDSMQGIGPTYMSKTYIFGNAVSDYYILTPYSGTNIITQYWSGTAWVTWDSHALDGTPTSPGYVARDGTNGPGVAGTVLSGAAATMAAGATLWRWVGNKPFFLAINDTADDEFAHLGYDYSFSDTIGNLAGIMYNNPSYTNGYITLDGVNDYIMYTSNPTLTNQLTLELWFKPDVTGIGTTWMAGREGAYRILYDQSNLQIIVATANNSWYSTGTVTSPVAAGWDGNWKHIVATYDGSNLRIYTNGSLLTTTSSTISGNLTSPSSNFCLGLDPTVGSIGYAKASYGSVRIYNTALSLSQIQQNYNATKSRYGL